MYRIIGEEILFGFLNFARNDNQEAAVILKIDIDNARKNRKKEHKNFVNINSAIYVYFI